MMHEFTDAYYDVHSKELSDISVINIGWEPCAPGYSYGPRVRSYHLIHFIASGKGILYIDGEEFPVSAGSAFIIPSDRLARYQADMADPWCYYWVGFTGTVSERILRKYMTNKDTPYVISPLPIREFAQVIQEGAALGGNTLENHFLAQSCLFRILALLSKYVVFPDSKTFYGTLAEEIKFTIDTKYTGIHTLQSVAEQFHIHPGYLTQLFRDTYQVTPKRYLTDLKLKKAAQLLKNTTLPVGEVATAVGFDDPLAFSRLFKKEMGLSPRAWREKSLEATGSETEDAS